jgi:DNA-binding NtrC family response regulator
VAKVILVGDDVALLEGLGQTLVGLGHDVTFATTVAEAAMANPDEAPALAVVSADALEDAGLAATLPLTPGGALIIYCTSHDRQPFLPPKLQRATLARLVLPLERHRLVALVKSFDTRSRTTGRSLSDEIADDLSLEF